MAAPIERTVLTTRQTEIYEYLRDQISRRGFGPTVREIGEHFNIKSPNGVICHLKALEKKGLIARESNMSRAIGLTRATRSCISVPCIGTAISGGPIQAAVSSDECVNLDPLFSGDDKACLRINGSDFESLGIMHGDLLLVSRDSYGDVGTLVAVLDEQHHLTLRRLAANGKQPTPAIPDSPRTQARQVLGKVVGVVRNFQCGAAAKLKPDANGPSKSNGQHVGAK